MTGLATIPTGSCPGLAPSFASFYVTLELEAPWRQEDAMQKLPPNSTPANMVLCVLLCNWLITFFTIAAVAQPKTAPLRIVVLGDSLVAGFQLKSSDAFPAQLERALKAKGHAVEVINAGVSGDTTAGGLERVAWAVPERTDAVILELGANDALRGLDPGRAKTNLDKIIATIKAGGAEVLLAGMLAPRNLGEDYGRRFNAIYSDLAKKHDLILYPFFLDGIALNGEFNLGDGIHPNPKGVAEITRRILPSVEELIARARARQTKSPKG
jgi:acyl-CoA thioesterase-1